MNDIQDRIVELTTRQRECLRLVYAHLDTKEIARELGLKPNSVYKYLTEATHTLGVPSRRIAARLLAEHEGLSPSHRLVSQPSALSGPAEEPADEAVVAIWDAERDRREDMLLRDVRTPYEPPELPSPRDYLPFPDPRGKHDRTLVQRLIAIMVAFAIIVFAIAVMLVLADAVTTHFGPGKSEQPRP